MVPTSWQEFRELRALLGGAAHLPVLIWRDVPTSSGAVLCLLSCPRLPPRGRSCRQQRWTCEALQMNENEEVLTAKWVIRTHATGPWHDE